MSSNPLILHVGMHKTGTTAIQVSLAANRAWLRSQGIEYPELLPGMGKPGTAHHAMAHALANPALRDRFKLFRFRRRIERAARDARLTVISAEAICRHRLGPEPADTAAFLRGHRAYLKRLARYLRNFSPTVLLYLRRPDSHLVSLYKEWIAIGDIVPDFGELPKMQPWLVAYPERIAALREVFGAVEVRIYESECDEGLLRRFYAMLGLPSPPVEAAPHVRVSPSNRAALWLRRAQREAPRSRREHGFRVMFTTTPEGEALFREQSPSTLWPSADDLKAFVARHRSAYEVGDFPALEFHDTPRTVWTDAMHAEAEAAFAEWERANKETLAERARHRFTQSGVR